ncbi:tachykinin-like peptides receptor 86C [Ixodes scapularis]|uniref:G-protein coupled octopamine receptor, putative n=1 Tax=Ixodes scapularis TaxID=6945 RepID=B7QM81_IXOSC|nr:tachykinin-like peptides receptor 86C [Ixodes scapularis]EEC19953.1 G-protein coupled octopamine receptor, putative [Ixodes scapularis]|eukprot:XP_002416286.1 G-protein coupled octopamine receptor, putative [Ixodes scapularis]
MSWKPSSSAAAADILAKFINSTGGAGNLSVLLEMFPDLLNTTSEFSVIEVGSERQWVLPWWVQLIYGVLFGSMVLVAAFGNAVVVWIVVVHRSMRTVTNYFLVNLSIANAMTATFNAIFNLVYMLESHWAFGSTYCIFNNFVANLTVSSSAFTIAATSIDR